MEMCSHKRKSSRGSNVVHESCSKRQRILYEHRENRDFFDLRADQAAQGEKAALSRLSEAEYHTRLLLEEQKNRKLSEARSELNMQELRFETADRALQDSGLQLHFQRIELHQANQLSHHSKREKKWPCTELKRRERELSKRIAREIFRR